MEQPNNHTRNQRNRLDKQRQPNMEQHNSLKTGLHLPVQFKHNHPHRRPILPRTIPHTHPIQQHRNLTAVLATVLVTVHLRLVHSNRANLPVLQITEKFGDLETALYSVRLRNDGYGYSGIS